MRDIQWLVQNMILRLLKNKRKFIMMTGMPLLGIFVSLLIYGGSGATTLHVGIVNQDPSKLTSNTIQFISELNHVQVSNVQEKAARDEISSGKLDCVVVFPKGFSQSLKRGDPISLRIMSIKGSSVTAYLKADLNNYIGNITSIGHAANGNDKRFDQMYQQYEQSSFKVRATPLNDKSKNKDMTYQTIGWLILFMMLSAFNLSSIIIKDKENGTYFRLMSTPVNNRLYVLANIIVNLMVMILQIIVALFFMIVVFHISPHIPLLQLFVSLVLFAFVSIGLSLVVVSIAGRSTAANALQTLLVTPTCLIAGCYFPIDTMPKVLKEIADFLPQHWLLDIIDQLQAGHSMLSLYLNYLILLAFAAAFFLIAVYKFGRSKDISI
ncbi:ABC transporter permease [Pullulanibacillus sp. KACC 23026]|uniref:ABC transporter permease n=1 Tax=Pullulanibacillus sp. KACC 23026 TaxID=3028315 RepID=UPI0023B1F429|nr:ABC transporter permease [Pullulanibacillus sp. KACC 23026]WEG11054.1 ABC transporter permease [Pullulanibacillus sp. KACC 23026]